MQFLGVELLGYHWLQKHYDLPDYPLTASSSVGTRLKETTHPDGSLVKVYPPQYRPTEQGLAEHLEFALKHEGVNLTLLGDLFRVCDEQEVLAMVEAKPTGKFARLAGFFYEWLTGKELPKSSVAGGNYIEALDSTKYWVKDNPTRNQRWRVKDNLTGSRDFCPLARKTPSLDELLAHPLAEELKGMARDFPPQLFARANDYLYLKETKSTYGIEREEVPPARRAERFVSLLREAGKGSVDDLLHERSLQEKQNLIVDPRYAAAGYRDEQSYVGEQRPDFSQRVHYICPPPAWVNGMMQGLAEAASTIESAPAIVRAGLVGFSFVFIHPFDDGNGRLHRFLIHDALHRGDFAATGLMLPVSATMLRLMGEYDAALERYSRPLMERLANYQLDDEGQLTLDEPEIVESYFRYPDLTSQIEYLAHTVALTVREDLARELQFLNRYDEARNSVLAVVELPDKVCDRLLKYLHQNKGRLSKKKRAQFAELTSSEVTAIEEAFGEIFYPSLP